MNLSSVWKKVSKVAKHLQNDLSGLKDITSNLSKQSGSLIDEITNTSHVKEASPNETDEMNFLDEFMPSPKVINIFDDIFEMTKSETTQSVSKIDDFLGSEFEERHVDVLKMLEGNIVHLESLKCGRLNGSKSEKFNETGRTQTLEESMDYF